MNRAKNHSTPVKAYKNAREFISMMLALPCMTGEYIPARKCKLMDVAMKEISQSLNVESREQDANKKGWS